MQALVIRISRDVYVLDITVNFMLNKRKSKKAAGAKPQTPLGSYQRFLRPPCCHGRWHAPSRTLPPVVNIFIRPPLSQNPGSAPDNRVQKCVDHSQLNDACICLLHLSKSTYKVIMFLLTLAKEPHFQTYAEMSGQKSEVINSRFANQRIFPYIYP